MERGYSFTKSSTRVFQLFLIATILLSEWSSVVSGTEYQRSESYTGPCTTEECISTCNTEGHSAGAKCRHTLLHLRRKCYCIISPNDGAGADAGADAGAGAGAGAGVGAGASAGAGAGAGAGDGGAGAGGIGTVVGAASAAAAAASTAAGSGAGGSGSAFAGLTAGLGALAGRFGFPTPAAN